MKNEHTPAPWKIAEEIAEEGIWIEGGNPDEPDEICKVSTTTISHGEAEANARLIAAAPELLEALQAFISGWPSSGAVINIHADVFKNARAAVAKACGEAEAIVAIPHIPTTDNEKHQAYLDYTNNFCTAQGFANHYGLTEEQGILLIRDGRKIHEASVAAANNFTVIAVSENTNSFGLKSILLLNEQGEGWQILKSPYGGEELPKRGDTIERVGGHFTIQHECLSPLKTCKPALAKKVIAEAKKK